MSFDTLQERLNALQETTHQLQELIKRLATLKYEPGSVPLGNTDNDNNMTAELSGEINQILREEEEDLDLLQEEIIDLRPGRPGSEAEHNKTRLKEGASRLDHELKSCRVAFRKAQLSARRNLEQGRRLERELLLASYATSAAATPQNRSGASSPGIDSNARMETPAQLFTVRDRRRAAQQKQRSSSQSRGEAEATASADLTAALRRTHDLISTELSRSEFAQQVLQESTVAMKELQQRYSTLDDMLASSRNLLGTLLKSQKSDTWYLQTAFYMLLATLSWLVFRRFMYGPLWWVVWLPIRTVFRTGKTVSSLGNSGIESAIMRVSQPGAGETRTVGVGEEGAVPTIQAGGGQTSPETQNQDLESLVEKVGRIVDESLDSSSEARYASAGGGVSSETNNDQDAELDNQPGFTAENIGLKEEL